MEGLGKKVGYLKGLMEGMDFSNDPSQGKLFGALFELVNDLSDRVEGMEEIIEDLNDYVESIDDDLSALEGERSDGYDMLHDDFFDEDYEDFDDDDEDKLHLLNGGAEHDSAHSFRAGNICVCSECEHLLFISLKDPKDAWYDCPHCGKRVKVAPLTPKNAPVVHPVEE